MVVLERFENPPRSQVPDLAQIDSATATGIVDDSTELSSRGWFYRDSHSQCGFRQTAGKSRARYARAASDAPGPSALQRQRLNLWHRFEQKKLLTVPHPDGTIPAAAHETIAPKLHPADKVLVHLPRPIGIRRGRYRKSPDGRRGTGKHVVRQRSAGIPLRMRYRPQDVHGHHALAGRQVPLPESLVGRPCNLSKDTRQGRGTQELE